MARFAQDRMVTIRPFLCFRKCLIPKMAEMFRLPRTVKNKRAKRGTNVDAIILFVLLDLTLILDLTVLLNLFNVRANIMSQLFNALANFLRGGRGKRTRPKVKTCKIITSTTSATFSIIFYPHAPVRSNPGSANETRE